jgi:hypothetical protein
VQIGLPLGRYHRRPAYIDSIEFHSLEEEKSKNPNKKMGPEDGLSRSVEVFKVLWTSQSNFKNFSEELDSSLCDLDYL